MTLTVFFILSLRSSWSLGRWNAGPIKKFIRKRKIPFLFLFLCMMCPFDRRNSGIKPSLSKRTKVYLISCMQFFFFLEYKIKKQQIYKSYASSSYHIICKKLIEWLNFVQEKKKKKGSKLSIVGIYPAIKATHVLFVRFQSIHILGSSGISCEKHELITSVSCSSTVIHTCKVANFIYGI